MLFVPHMGLETLACAYNVCVCVCVCMCVWNLYLGVRVKYEICVKQSKKKRSLPLTQGLRVINKSIPVSNCKCACV